MSVRPLMSIVSRALEGWPDVSAGPGVLVGLSGGADSVALLDCMADLGRQRGFRVAAAHLDHGLRPGSAQDAAFCAELCGRLGVPLTAGQADVRGRARREKGGLEAAARRERYEFLRRVRDTTGAGLIAVAHTRDDQAETVLLHLLRGAGSTGLAGMRARSGDVLRPLLAAARQDVHAHLEARGLTWREDPSNADLRFQRNRVRHELLPYLEARFNPRIREGLARTATLLAAEARLLAPEADALFERAARQHDGRWRLSRQAVAGAPRALAREVVRRLLERAGGLQRIGARHVEGLLDLAAAEAASGRRLALPGGREAICHFEEILVGPRADTWRPFAIPLPVPGRACLPGGSTVQARRHGGPARTGHASAVVPACGELVVRTRRAGDRVHACGRQMSLKRFFMERRVPATDRAGLPLVAVGPTVVWVPGQPADPWPAGDAGGFVRLEFQGATP